MPLHTEGNFHEPGKRFLRPYRAADDFYEALIETHRDLTDEESAKVNARLVLILANQVGDLSILREAMRLAREGL